MTSYKRWNYDFLLDFIYSNWKNENFEVFNKLSIKGAILWRNYSKSYNLVSIWNFYHFTDLDKLNLVKFAFSVLVLGSSQIFDTTPAAPKTPLVPQVVKRDSQVIILLRYIV